MKGRTFFKGLQGALIAAAGVALTRPDIVTAFVPRDNQGQVMAGLTLAAAILPSVAPRVVRKWWGGGQGGDQDATPNLTSDPTKPPATK